LIDSGFTASVGTDGDCEADGWEVWVSVLCAACGDVAVPDKNGNKMKTVARVIQESRVAVKSSYAFVRHLTYHCRVIGVNPPDETRLHPPRTPN
jgi:hypothetical protein